MSKKFTQLSLIDAVSATDILPIVDDPAGTPVTKKCTVTQLTALCEKLASKDVANGYAGLNANGDVPLSHLFPASAASLLLGRGSAGGAGDWQEVTLGTGLSMVGTVLTGTAPAGGGAWTFITSVTASAANHDFTGLSSYNEIMVAGYLLTVSSGPSVIQVLVSTDSVNYLNASGDYLQTPATGISTNDTSLSTSGNSSSTRNIMRVITNFNSTRPKFSWMWNAVADNASYVIPVASALQAIRVRVHTGSFSGGTLYVYGRS